MSNVTQRHEPVSWADLGAFGIADGNADLGTPIAAVVAEGAPTSWIGAICFLSTCLFEIDVHAAVHRMGERRPRS